jgi:hypothetical protein
VTGAGLVVAPSLLARLLFGSEMNASGGLVGRISGLVMLCLAVGCWPRGFQGEDRQALRGAYLMGVAELHRRASHQDDSGMSTGPETKAGHAR